jgi:hypothetical protein
MNNKKITLQQFNFKANGRGQYLVTYTTHGGNVFKKIIDDMKLIENTKNAENPRGKDLIALRKKIQEIKN